ncbi:ABC-2 type transport system permease protein [Anaerovirgula multivorans]|uniref:ABC-2 type transport system permease protein n=2 Tax=Anaerovirgula multivorans TaxID=312168 RepID=A0A239J493_9FIRM|nr:ABC-2 type transport system permease protein [Anaerovirgula multivorans]
MAKDFTLAFRDQIMLYMLIMPLLLSFIFSLFISSLQNTQVSFVIDSSVEETVVQGLQQYGKVIVLESNQAVKERVLGIDDVVGITKVADKYNIILEGNELESLRELAGMTLDQVISGQYFGDYQVESLGKEESQFKNVIVIVMILMGILMGGLLSAFNIIDEKESRSIHALGVTPLSFGEMLLARGLMALIIGVMLGVGNALIMVGTQVNYLLLIIGVLFSVTLSLLIGFGIGSFANSQIEGIALLKVVFLVFMGVPIAALFIPAKWIWVLYPFPNYWAFEAFNAIMVRPLEIGNFWFSNGILLAISVVLILLLTPIMKKHLFTH